MKPREKLIRFREEQHLSQTELARILGVTRQAVSGWERGASAPTMEKLAALSRLYGVPLEELVGEGPPVAVAEAPEAPPPVEGEAPGKRGRSIAAAIGLGVCLLVVVIAAVITIVSAILKEPAPPKDGLTIVDQDDLVGEDVDLSEVQDMTGSNGITIIQKED